MAILEGLSATKAGFELIRGALELLKREDLDRHEIAARLLELQALVLETRQALSDADDENRSLKRELADNSNLMELEKDLFFTGEEGGGVFLLNTERAGGIFKPYCPICWADDRKLIPLVEMASRYYSCVKHKQSHDTSGCPRPRTMRVL